MGNKKYNSTLILYISVQSAVLSSINLLQFADIRIADFLFYTAMVLGLGLGIFHVKFMNTFSQSLIVNESLFGLGMAAVIVIVTLIVSALICQFAQLSFLFPGYIISFIVPCLFSESYKRFQQIM